MSQRSPTLGRLALMSILFAGCGGDRARMQAELERRAQPPAQPAPPVAGSPREEPPPPPDWTDVAALASAVAAYVARESVLKDRPFTVSDVALVLQTQLTDTVYVVSDDEAHLLAEADASGVPAILDFAFGPAPGGGVVVTGASLMQLGNEARYAYIQVGERWARRLTGEPA